MPISLLMLEIAKSPICAKIEIIKPKNKHSNIEKLTTKTNNEQIIQEVIKFAIAPPIVLFGLISGASFLLNFGPIFEAMKSPHKIAKK